MAVALIGLALLGCTDRGVRAAVASDREAGTPGTPPELHLLQLGERTDPVSGRMFVAAGEGPHPTVLLLHDLPGVELHLDLAHAIRRTGWNVLAPHFSAASGQEVGGRVSLDRLVRRTAGLVAFLRTPYAGERYRVDPGRIVLLGHGVGGAAALAATAGDPGVLATGSLAGYVPGEPGRDSGGGDRESAPRSPRTGPLEAAALAIGERPVLLLAATRDSLAPPARDHEPLVEALGSTGPWLLSHDVLAGDHDFVERRIALATAVVAWLRVVDRSWARSVKDD